MQNQHLRILFSFFTQGSHRLEKSLNLEGFLEKSLKNKHALKSTGKSIKGLEKVLEFFNLQEESTVYVET